MAKKKQNYILKGIIVVVVGLLLHMLVMSRGDLSIYGIKWLIYPLMIGSAAGIIIALRKQFTVYELLIIAFIPMFFNIYTTYTLVLKTTFSEIFVFGLIEYLEFVVFFGVVYASTYIPKLIKKLK